VLLEQIGNDVGIVSKTEGILEKIIGNSRIGPCCRLVNQQTACADGEVGWIANHEKEEMTDPHVLVTWVKKVVGSPWKNAVA
jgi:hypothetical protein